MNYRLLMAFLMLFSIAAFGKHRRTDFQPQGINGLYKFAGKLNGKYPVFLWFRMKDSVIKGEVTYVKTAQRRPITLIGTLTHDGITLREFAKNGNVTGSYYCTFSKGGLVGEWWAPGAGKGLKYALPFKDTLLTNIDTALTAVAVDGTYRYSFGKNGSVGEIHIKRVGPGNFLFDINCVTPAPAYNIAEVETFKAQMVNNDIIYKLPNQDCRFKIRVFNTFAIISYIGSPTSCTFGAGADIEGVFLKTTGLVNVR